MMPEDGGSGLYWMPPEETPQFADMAEALAQWVIAAGLDTEEGRKARILEARLHAAREQVALDDQLTTAQKLETNDILRRLADLIGAVGMGEPE